MSDALALLMGAGQRQPQAAPQQPNPLAALASLGTPLGQNFQAPQGGDIANLLRLLGQVQGSQGLNQAGRPMGLPQDPVAQNQQLLGQGLMGYGPSGGNVHFMGGLPFRPPTGAMGVNASTSFLTNLLNAIAQYKQRQGQQGSGSP